MEEKVYLFQNWDFGSTSLEKFKEWDIRGEKYKLLKEQDIVTHTDDRRNSFLILSFDKEKLLKLAKKRKQDRIEECEYTLNWLKQLKFED